MPWNMPPPFDLKQVTLTGQGALPSEILSVGTCYDKTVMRKTNSVSLFYCHDFTYAGDSHYWKMLLDTWLKLSPV